MKTINNRTTQYDINDIFLKRYSPRAFSGEVISDEDLMTLFDAARWAPSSYNNQPCRFIYAKAGTPYFDAFFALLTEGNKVWCQRASALIIVASKETMDYDGKPSITHSFDAGAAWENLALQAAFMGIIAHGMQGFDYAKAKEVAGFPDGYRVEAMLAIGKHGNIEDLPEKVREGEKPNGRKELKEIVFEGKFSQPQ